MAKPQILHSWEVVRLPNGEIIARLVGEVPVNIETMVCEALVGLNRFKHEVLNNGSERRADD